MNIVKGCIVMIVIIVFGALLSSSEPQSRDSHLKGIPVERLLSYYGGGPGSDYRPTNGKQNIWDANYRSARDDGDH